MKANILKTIGLSIVKHERVILTTVTIVAEGVAIWQAFKQGPKFKEVKEKYENGEYTKQEAAKAMAVPVAKVAVPFMLSTGAAILNHQKASEEVAKWANLYTIGRTVSDEYKLQVAKEIGEEKEKEISDATAKGMISKDAPEKAKRKAHRTGHGDTLYYDVFSDRWFYSDANFMKSTVNALNEKMLDAKEYEENNPVMLSELYSEWGLPRNKQWDHFMFDHDTGLIRFDITPDKAEDGQLYGIVQFKREPRVIRW